MKGDLKEFMQKIADFFEFNKFEDITAIETGTGYEIVAGNSKKYKVRKDIMVSIEGQPEDFSVNLDLVEEEKGYSLPVMLTTMFGGGYLLLRSLKSDEDWMKFQAAFWNKIESIVAVGQHVESTP